MVARSHFALVTTILVSAIVASPVHAQVTVPLRLPAQDLGKSLKEVARATGSNIVFDPAVVSGRKAPALSGRYTAESAIGHLIVHQPLQLRSTGSGTFVVSAVGNAQDGQSGGLSGSSVEPSGAVAGRDNTLSSEPDSSIDRTIVVTGTNIAGSRAVGADVETYTRADFDRSGAQSLEQFSRRIPANFSSADPIANQNSNATLFARQGSSGATAFGGSGFNLLGLGTGATLTLLNGKRLSPAGYDGSLTDISLIPMSAVERIDVLPNGASAIYGADAVAGVVNIITRSDFKGLEVSLSRAGATQGGARELDVSLLGGTSWESGGAFISFDHDEQHGLDVSERSYTSNHATPFSLIPKSRRNSFFLNVHQELTPSTSIEVTALQSARKFHSDLNDANDSALIDSSLDGRAKQWDGVVSLRQQLPAGWIADLTGQYSRTRQSSVSENSQFFPDFGFGFDFLSELASRSSERSLTGRLSGSLGDFGAGAIKLALGASYRGNRFVSDNVTILDGTPFPTGIPSSRRSVASLFGELLLPLIGARGRTGQHLLLSVAGRYDHYSDFGGTFNPRLALEWAPTDGLVLYGSYGTSFRAPLLSQLNDAQFSSTMLAADPSDPSGFTDTLILSGGNHDLKPERSRMVALGVRFSPNGMSNLQLHASIYDIRFKDRISQPLTSGFFSLDDPALGSFIIRNPPLDLVESFFASPTFAGDGVGTGPAGVAAIFDSRTANMASTRQTGLRYGLTYSSTLEGGALDLSAEADHLLKFRYKPTPTAAAVNLLNSFVEPLRFKSRATASWTKGSVSTSFTLNYSNPYRVGLGGSDRRIGSWTTADWFASYRILGEPQAPGGRAVDLQLSVANIFDAKPPKVLIPPELLLPGQVPLPFDPANASPLGRYISARIRARI